MSSLKEALSKWRPWPSASSSSHYHQLQELPPFSPFLSSKKLKSPTPLVVGKHPHHTQIFFIEPHILDHWLFQDLLLRSRLHSQWAVQDWEEVDFFAASGSRNKIKADCVPPIWLDCDAILFEFFLWLVQNDDPSLRDLNLNDLMEFYDAES